MCRKSGTPWGRSSYSLGNLLDHRRPSRRLGVDVLKIVTNGKLCEHDVFSGKPLTYCGPCDLERAMPAERGQGMVSLCGGGSSTRQGSPAVIPRPAPAPRRDS